MPKLEAAAHSLSFSDYNGRLLTYHGNLYRAIPADQAGLYRALFQQGVVQALVEERLLVDTWIAPLELAPYKLVLQHRKLPLVSYPQEWCAAMLKAAALHHIDCCLALDRYDLTTDDAHPINILFEGTRPLFVDFGSINRLRKDIWYPWPWPPYEQFCQMFLYPLLLAAQGHSRLARVSMHDFESGVLRAELSALIWRPWTRLRFAEVGKAWMQKVGYRSLGRLLLWATQIGTTRRAFLQQVRQEIEGISLPDLQSPPDLRSPKKGNQAIASIPKNCLPANYDLVEKILSELSPSTVLDVNSGQHQGSYALLAAALGSQVVAIDPDEAPVEQLYFQAKRQALPILPLIMNFASPSSGLSNRFFEPAHQRLKCDLVLAVALDESLVIKRGFNFIVERLAIFSRRWLLIEFIPRAGATMATRWRERVVDCSWYSLENFLDTLKTHFNRVEMMPSSPSPRVLLLCEKAVGEDALLNGDLSAKDALHNPTDIAASDSLAEGYLN